MRLSRQEALRRLDGFKNPDLRDVCAREAEKILEAQKKASQDPADLASIDAALAVLQDQRARSDEGRQPKTKWDELGPLP